MVETHLKPLSTAQRITRDGLLSTAGEAELNNPVAYILMSVIAILIADRLLAAFWRPVSLDDGQEGIPVGVPQASRSALEQVIQRARDSGKPVPVSKSGSQYVRVISSDGPPLWFLNPDLPRSEARGAGVSLNQVQHEAPPDVVAGWPTSRLKAFLKRRGLNTT